MNAAEPVDTVSVQTEFEELRRKLAPERQKKLNDFIDYMCKGKK